MQSAELPLLFGSQPVFVINGKSQAFVAESDLSQNYTVLKATDELIKRFSKLFLDLTLDLLIQCIDFILI